MKGKLIVIDGLDGTGKQTQVDLLYKYLCSLSELDHKMISAKIDFPRYGKESAHMVESYLQGKFGTDPNVMDPYTASMFYAIDRSISYKTELWGHVYNNGGLVIADRYSCSNFIHQASKLDNWNHPNSYILHDFVKLLDWIYTTEHDNIGIPRPDLIIYLKSSEEANRKMLEGRIKAGQAADIHEANNSYLNKCRTVLDNYEKHINFVTHNQRANTYQHIDEIHHEFLRIDDENFNIKSREEIHEEIKEIIYNHNLL